MKKFTLMVAGLALAVGGYAQSFNPQTGTAVMGPKQYQAQTIQPKLDMIYHAENVSMMRASEIPDRQLFSPNGKTASVNSIQLGSASNVFTILRTEQNQVYANDDLDLVMFFHRNDLNNFGGSSGNLRFDFSTDGGVNWSNDVGEVNPLLTRPARYPNVTAYNPPGNQNPANTKMVYSAPTLNPSPDWDGHVTGVWDISPSSTGSENYDLLGQNSYLQGGLTEGLPGEFWTVDVRYDGTTLGPDIFINKGVWNVNNNDIDWEREDTLSPPHFTGFDNAARVVGPNIAFSPDGQTGWIAWLGDLQGGIDTTYAPCLIKSTDGGATWDTQNYYEFDYNAVPWIRDSLLTLWTDSMMNPASSGEATTGFDFDLAVDGQGNPHVLSIVGSRTLTTAGSDVPGYSIFSAITKFLTDFYTTDGGATWNAAYISPILTFRTPEYGTTTTVTMDNQPQIARTPSGNIMFYSWADSDTAQFTGSMNGVGFGESSNLAPNLRYSARHAYTGAQSYPTLVTDGDLTWEGRALFPTMAPEVISCSTGDWRLPIVIAEFTDPLQQTFFHYFGDEACFDENRFCDPSGLSLSWDVIGSGVAPCPLVGVNDPVNGVILGNSYPNPTAGEAVITFELPAVTNLTMTLRNMYGAEVAVLANGEYTAGAHRVTAQTAELAAGVYFYTLAVDGKNYTKKMIVTK
ncbi:MAG: T9SS type A sorting domain-containing protein [Bacteroidota bacterium]